MPEYDCTRLPDAKTNDQFLAVAGGSIYEGLGRTVTLPLEVEVLRQKRKEHINI